MEAQAFRYLYINLNSIAELALQQFARKVLSDPAPPTESLSPEQLEARMLENFSGLDFSALDAVHDQSFDVAIPAEELAALESMQTDGEGPVAGDEDLDMESYLVRAYASQDQLRDRLDRHYGRADLEALSKLLERLPPELPALTAPLSVHGLTQWLALYETGEQSLSDLIVAIRQLDMGS